MCRTAKRMLQRRFVLDGTVRKPVLIHPPVHSATFKIRIQLPRGQLLQLDTSFSALAEL